MQAKAPAPVVRPLLEAVLLSLFLAALALAAPASAKTGLAASTSHPVYTWRLRGPDNQVVREFTSEFSGSTETFTWRQDYFYGDSRLLATDGNNTDWQRSRLYYFIDHLGSPRLITDSTGTVVSRPTFLPYGEDISDWRDEGAMRFTAHERDFDRLDYMRARFYDNALQRFLSPDPAREGWSLYAYANDDPVNLVDRSGMGAAAAQTVFIPGEGLGSGPGTFVRPGGGFVGGRPVGARVLEFRPPASATPSSWTVAEAAGRTYLFAQAFMVGWTIGEVINYWPTDEGRLGDLVSDNWSDALVGDAANESAPTQGPARYRRVVEFGGNKVFQRNDLIDPKRIDAQGRSNVERMREGLAPIGPDGKSIVIHHLLQTAAGPLVELEQTLHSRFHGLIHINPSSIPSGIDRGKFERWRRRYWMFRARDFE